LNRTILTTIPILTIKTNDPFLIVTWPISSDAR
jgi:hypothetical protein